MTKTIWKFNLSLIFGDMAMPAGAVILSVQLQNDVPTIWAQVNPEVSMTKRKIRVYGTGHFVSDEPATYIGTIQQNNFVWHVYDAGE